MVTGKPKLEIKPAPTEFHMKNAHLGDYRRQTMRQLSYEEYFFDLQQTFSFQYFNSWIVLIPLNKSDQITSQWITAIRFPDTKPLDIGCLGWIAFITIEKVGPVHQIKNESTTRNSCVFSHRWLIQSLGYNPMKLFCFSCTTDEKGYVKTLPAGSKGTGTGPTAPLRSRNGASWVLGRVSHWNSARICAC